MKDPDQEVRNGPAGRPPAEPPTPRGDVSPTAARPPAPASRDRGGPELDLAIDEIAPTRNLKEGFTGQER